MSLLLALIYGYQLRLNIVLKQKGKVSPTVLTIEEVIAQNEEAEKKVSKAADDLHQVNAELAKQVSERIDIESELLETKNNLFEARADLSKSQALSLIHI